MHLVLNTTGMGRGYQTQARPSEGWTSLGGFAGPRPRPATRRPTPPLSSSRTDDATILALLVAREPRAIELAYDQWAAALMSVATGITRDADAAEQLVANAYMKLWRDPDWNAIYQGTLLAYLFHLVVAGSR